MRGEMKKKKCCICSLKRLPYKRRLVIVFSPGLTELVCAYIHYRSVIGCVYSTIVWPHYNHTGYIT